MSMNPLGSCPYVNTPQDVQLYPGSCLHLHPTTSLIQSLYQKFLPYQQIFLYLSFSLFSFRFASTFWEKSSKIANEQVDVESQLKEASPQEKRFKTFTQLFSLTLAGIGAFFLYQAVVHHRNYNLSCQYAAHDKEIPVTCDGSMNTGAIRIEDPHQQEIFKLKSRFGQKILRSTFEWGDPRQKVLHLTATDRRRRIGGKGASFVLRALNLRKLIVAADYRISEVSNIQQMCQKIADFAEDRFINLLILTGHGGTEGDQVIINRADEMGRFSEKSFGKIPKDCFAPVGQIVLDSCEAGKKFAKPLADFSGKKVTASPDTVFNKMLEVKSIYPHIEIAFNSPQHALTRTNTYYPAWAITHFFPKYLSAICSAIALTDTIGCGLRLFGFASERVKKIGHFFNEAADKTMRLVILVLPLTFQAATRKFSQAYPPASAAHKIAKMVSDTTGMFISVVSIQISHQNVE